jgi:protein TonB
MGSVVAAGSAFESKAVWLGALVGSLVVHVAVFGLVTSWQAPLAAKTRQVVPVEVVTLTKVTPAPAGGGGGLAEPASPPLPRPTPSPQPKARPKTEKIKKVKQSERIETPEPPPALAIPRPAAPAPPSRPAVAGPTATAGLGRGTEPGQGQGGRGLGSGGGRGPGVGPGQGPGSGTGSLLQGYLREVRRLLERQKQYPRMAQRLNIQGVVVLKFTIAADGRVAGAALGQSSGHQILDTAAQDTVARVGRFPPLPPALGRDRLAIEIPLAFRLRQ